MRREVLAVFLHEKLLHNFRLVVGRCLIESLVELEIFNVTAGALIYVKNWQHVIARARMPQMITRAVGDRQRVRRRTGLGIGPGTVHRRHAMAVLTIHLDRTRGTREIGTQVCVVIELDLTWIPATRTQRCELWMLLVKISYHTRELQAAASS